MEILRKGENPSKKQHVAECTWCHTVIRFFEYEAKKFTSPRNESHLIVDCPECGLAVYLEMP